MFINIYKISSNYDVIIQKERKISIEIEGIQYTFKDEEKNFADRTFIRQNIETSS